MHLPFPGRRTRPLCLVAAFAVAAISLAGCGGMGDDDYIATLRGAVPDPSATPAPTTEPTMTVPIPTEPPAPPAVPTPTPEIIAPVPTVPPPPTTTPTAWIVFVTATPEQVARVVAGSTPGVEPCPAIYLRGKRCIATPAQIATYAAESVK